MDRRTFLTYARCAAIAPLALQVGLALGRTPHGYPAVGTVQPRLSNPIGALMAGGGIGSRVYENFANFKNRVRESGGFANPSSGSVQVALTTAGWPAADFQCILWEGTSVPGWMSAASPGTPFTCGFIGTGSETITGSGSCTIANIVHGTGGAYTTFQVTSATGTFAFVVTGTTGGVTNVFAYLPEYPGSSIDNPISASAFTNEALAFYANLDHIQLEWPSICSWNSQLNTSATRQAYASPWSAAATNCQTFGNGRAVNSGAGNVGTFSATPSGTSATLNNWYWGPGTWGITMQGTNTYALMTVTGGTVNTPSTNVPVTFSASLGGQSSASFYYGVEGFPTEIMLALAIAANTGIFVNNPILEDGTNGAAGSWTSAVMQLIANAVAANPLWTGDILFQPLANEPWNSGYLTYRMLFQNYPTGPYGYATVADYVGYRMHAFAQLGRTYFPTLWGTRVGSVLGWQEGGSNGFYSPLAYMVTQGWTPSADIMYGAIAPYANPTGLTTSSSISAIEAAMSAVASSQATSSTTRSENIAITLMHYGIKLLSYELNFQWNGSGYSGMTNLAAAIQDPGYAAPVIDLIAGCLNSGHTKISWSTDGLTTSASPGGGSGGDEFGAGPQWATGVMNTPVGQALKSFMPGGTNYPFIPTRNVINGSGSIISGGNYADKTAASLPGFPAGIFSNTNGSPYYTLQGYIGYFFNCLVPGTYEVVLTMSGTGAPTTNVEIGSAPSGYSIPITGKALAVGANSLGQVTLPAGPGYILFGAGGAQSTLLIDQIQFN